MPTEAQPRREDLGRDPQIERPDERARGDLVSKSEGQDEGYEGPDPERADDPPVPEEDQGV
jgi:hypothetical protein